MQPVEDFLREYFRARTEMCRALARLCHTIDAQYFTPTYDIFGSDKSVRDSQAESIVAAETSDGTAEVITTAWLGGQYQMRYRLSAIADAWKITGIETECAICRSGKLKELRSNCPLCKGTGWNLIGEIRAA